MPTDPHAPPRPELLALLDAVKDHPDEDTPRLVLADWLDEQDDPLDAERAAFIRADIAAYRERGGSNLAPPSEGTRAVELSWRWLGQVPDYGKVAFHRGLPTIWLTGPGLLNKAFRPLLASEAFAFVQFVRLTEAGGSRMEAIAALPELRYVPGLSLDPFHALGTHYAGKFFGSPHVTGLRQIEFRSVKPGAAGLQSLAANPALGRLRRLWLQHNKLVDKGVIALAGSTNLPNLQILDLADNNVGDAGAEAMANSPNFPSLRELNLRANPRLTDRGRQLLRAKFGDRVKLD